MGRLPRKSRLRPRAASPIADDRSRAGTGQADEGDGAEQQTTVTGVPISGATTFASRATAVKTPAIGVVPERFPAADHCVTLDGVHTPITGDCLIDTVTRRPAVCPPDGQSRARFAPGPVRPSREPIVDRDPPTTLGFALAALLTGSLSPSTVRRVRHPTRSCRPSRSNCCPGGRRRSRPPGGRGRCGGSRGRLPVAVAVGGERGPPDVAAARTSVGRRRRPAAPGRRCPRRRGALGRLAPRCRW